MSNKEIWKKEEEEKKKLEFMKKSATIQEGKNNFFLQRDISNNDEDDIKEKPKTYEKQKANNSFLEINEFLNEFEGYNMLENFEERKFCVPSSLNIKEIDRFFNRVKENQQFFQFE